MTKQTFDQIQVNLPPDVLIKARDRARSLGLTISEYMQSLVDKDVAVKEHDPWREPVPSEVNERWEKEIAEFYEQEQVRSRPSAKTAAECIILLDEEASFTPDNEGN